MIGHDNSLHENPFLGPILSRWRSNPEWLVGDFYDGESWKSVNLGEFMISALRFSALMLEAGALAEDVVLIILQHGVEAHAAFIGTMLIGAIPSFMPYPSVKQDSALYWRQHERVFKRIRPRVIVVYEGLKIAASQAANGTDAQVVDAMVAQAKSPAPIGRTPLVDATALLQHSSGTTGLKKGVQLSYRAISDHLQAYSSVLHLDSVADARFASWLPLYHDMGLVTSFLMPIWRGIPILSIDPFDWTKKPSLLFDAIQDYRATHTWLPNFALQHQVHSVRGSRTWDLSSLVAVVCCSEPCKPKSFDAFVSRFSSWGIAESILQTSYAMAETVFAVTQSHVNKPVRRLVVDRTMMQTRGKIVVRHDTEDVLEFLSNGPPLPSCHVQILKDDKFVEEHVVGEICVEAPWLFSGYYKNPDATREAFKLGWLRTGDLGFIDGGELFVVGRSKEVIIINGKNVFAHDVEAAVSKVPHIKSGRAVAFGLYSETVGSEQLVVVAERSDGEEEGSIASLINHAVLEEVGIGCNDVRVVAQGWLIKTTSGKLSRDQNSLKYVETFLDKLTAQ